MIGDSLHITCIVFRKFGKYWSFNCVLLHLSNIRFIYFQDKSMIQKPGVILTLYLGK